MTRPRSSRAITRTAGGPGFRGDVQGLRAVAVLSVIAGHAGVPFLPGGFVGVDVFFVISGYLISSLLFREVAREGTLSLRDFYARRARRILPAATLVTLATLVAAFVWISLVDALDAVTDAFWATLFVANVHFARVGTDYFAKEEGPSPLQHYWSLSVEEQFYLIWPLILLACVLVARRRRVPGARAAQRPRLPRLAVFVVLAALGSASLVYGLVLTWHSPAAAYFSTLARIWELAIGALAALVAGTVAARLGPRARGLLCLSGLTAIAGSCVRYGEDTPFPGAAALLPVLGAAAVLLAGAGGHHHEPWPIRVLRLRPLQVVGDWSYSLYLWHWPLLLIPALNRGTRLTAGPATFAVIMTFVLAGLTYRFVETPFRNPVRVSRYRALALYPASVGLVGVACLAGVTYGKVATGSNAPPITVANSGLLDSGATVSRDPTVALVQASVQAARNRHEIPGDLSPDVLRLRADKPDVGECDYEIDDLRMLCPRGDPTSGRSIVVLGNSHGRMWIPAFDLIAERESYAAYYLVKPNCTAADLMVSRLGNNDSPWPECSAFREWALEQIGDLHPDLVVVSTSKPNRVIYTEDGSAIQMGDPERLAVTRQGFVDLFDRLRPLTDRVVLLRDVPKAEREPGPCLTTGNPDLGTCMFTPMESQELETNASVVAAQATGTDYVDPRSWLCWQNQCPAVVGSTITYRDVGHLTTVYATELADDLGRELGIWAD